MIVSTFWTKEDNQVVWMRKDFFLFGKNLNLSYWTLLSGYTDPNVRLFCLYNQSVNYLDQEFMMKEESNNYHGDQLDAVMFAVAFQCQVVIFNVQSGVKSKMQLVDVQTFDHETGTGLLLSASNGIHIVNQVPAGPSVL